MATRRMINKDDTEHPKYFRLEVRQRYLFDHLMLYADDDGIIPYDLIKPKIFAIDSIDEVDILNDLKKLTEKGFVQQYASSDGEVYVAVKSWWSRQYIRHNFYRPTCYPKPPDYSPRPKDMKRGPKHLEQDEESYSEIDAAQNKEVKNKGDETNSAQIRKAEEQDELDSDDEKFPYEKNGNQKDTYR